MLFSYCWCINVGCLCRKYFHVSVLFIRNTLVCKVKNLFWKQWCVAFIMGVCNC